MRGLSPAQHLKKSQYQKRNYVKSYIKVSASSVVYTIVENLSDTSVNAKVAIREICLTQNSEKNIYFTDDKLRHVRYNRIFSILMI